MDKEKFQLTRAKGQPVGDSKYGELGKYDITTVIRRFGTWNKVLIKANLQISNRVNICDEKLFENILRLWQHYGRQPRRRDLSDAPSTISQYPYNRRFGS